MKTVLLAAATLYVISVSAAWALPKETPLKYGSGTSTTAGGMNIGVMCSSFGNGTLTNLRTAAGV